MGKALMVQGTASSVGKSLLVTALCRIYRRRGVKVAPFKAQNMSNNAAITVEGGEIGRAQALQAIAAGVEPTVEMNPVLLKPESDMRSQVVVLGKAWRTLPAGEFYRQKDVLWNAVTRSLDLLLSRYDLVIIEGAGSSAELNLRHGDIVNMAVAKYAAAPVLLVGDIERGGIFAQLLGTLWLLPPDERRLVRGLIVNKFRGDAGLFVKGIEILREKSGLPVLGVVPYIHDLKLPEEDAATLSGRTHRTDGTVVAVVHLPHISNFDDFDPLSAEKGVEVRFVTDPAGLKGASAVAIPGTKSTIADLTWMRRSGMSDAVTAFAKAGGSVVGICGGYQMLGRSISDPEHVESDVEQVDALGLLPVRTRFSKAKSTSRAEAVVEQGLPGWMRSLAGLRVKGYEIHNGETSGNRAWLKIVKRNGRHVRIPDGHVSRLGRIWGTYLHGIFENIPLRRAWLESIGWSGDASGAEEFSLEKEIDRLADHVERHLDMRLLDSMWMER